MISLMSMGVSDQEILRLSYDRPGTFSQLFDRHQKRFLSIARKATSSRDEAEDIVQESFIRIYKHGRKFLAKGGNFKSWSDMILRNCIIDQITKRKGQDVSLTEEMENFLIATDNFDSFESNNYIQSVFDKISSAKAEVLKLRYVLGKSFKEIGKILGITSGAARVRVYRAKRDFILIHNQLNINAYGT